jgi:hypothetical protein
MSRDPMNVSRRESPEEYAQRRANETGHPYIVTMMGHAWPDFPDNRESAIKTCGGIAGTFRRARKLPRGQS